MRPKGKVVPVVGTQWGDEGKGKIIDFLAPAFNIIARSQGGHNAGHTLSGGKVVHIAPSGLFHGSVECIIGNGAVIYPQALLKDLALLGEKYSLSKWRIMISERAHLITPWHVALDKARETAKGKSAIGTTGSGIGPAYEAKMARTGLRVVDIKNIDFSCRLLGSLKEANKQLELLGAEPLSQDCLVEYLEECLKISELTRDTTNILYLAIQEGKSVLLEGAQSTHLDIDHGTYPYVTSSNASVGGVCTGTGIAPTLITETLGVAKAYTTRVGGGPFVTELKNDLGDKLRVLGHEYGATTGRPRRCGWFDAVAVRDAVRINNLDALAITKLDILDGLDELWICEYYKYGDEKLYRVPADREVLEYCQMRGRSLAGWKSSTAGTTEKSKLPAQAILYLKVIEELCECPIKIISTGPEHYQTIVCHDAEVMPWIDDRVEEHQFFQS